MARSKGTGTLQKRGKYYHLIYVVNGKKTYKSLRTSNKRDAEQIAKDLMADTLKIDDTADFTYRTTKSKNIVKQINFSLQQIFPTFEEKFLLKKNILTSTANRYKFRINSFLDWLTDNKKDIINMSQITPEIAEEYSNRLNDTKIASKTYNDTIRALQKVFDILKEQAGLLINPFSNIERKELQTVQKQGITEKEVTLLMNTISSIDIDNKAELETLFNIGAYTGARLKDCCLLKWDSIDFNSNTIKFTPFKTKKHKNRAVVPILDELKPVLIEADKLKYNSYVIPAIAELYLKNRKYVITEINKIFRISGLKDNKAEAIQKSGINKPCLFGFHSFRYFFITQCARNKVHPSLVQEAVGHSSPMMTDYYTMFNNEDRQNGYGLGKSLKSRIINLLDTADSKTLDQIYNILNTCTNGNNISPKMVEISKQ